MTSIISPKSGRPVGRHLATYSSFDENTLREHEIKYSQPGKNLLDIFIWKEIGSIPYFLSRPFSLPNKHSVTTKVGTASVSSEVLSTTKLLDAVKIEGSRVEFSINGKNTFNELNSQHTLSYSSTSSIYSLLQTPSKVQLDLNSKSNTTTYTESESTYRSINSYAGSSIVITDTLDPDRQPGSYSKSTISITSNARPKPLSSTSYYLVHTESQLRIFCKKEFNLSKVEVDTDLEPKLVKVTDGETTIEIKLS